MLVELRPVQDGDRPFLQRVYASTREAELAAVPWSAEQKAAFVAMQFHAQTTHYARHYGDADYDIVLVDGAPAGRLIVLRGAADVRIVDIALLPAFRGLGIGTRLLQPLIDEAERTGRTLSIHVEHMNPARRLYERLGFRRAGEEGVYLLMERVPQEKTAS